MQLVTRPFAIRPRLAVLLTCVALAAAQPGCSPDLLAPPPMEEPGLPLLEEMALDRLGSGSLFFQRAWNRPPASQVVVRADGEGRMIRQWNHGWIEGAAISPDGESMAFLRYTPGTIGWDVFVMQLSSGFVRRVSHDNGNREGRPSWSPEGYVVYAVVSGDLSTAIYRHHPTAMARELVATVPKPADDEPCPRIDFFHDALSVSPNGTLLFICGEDLYTVAAGTSAVTLLGRGMPRMVQAVWSPTADRLAFAAWRNEGAALFVDVYVMSARGGVAQSVAALAVAPDADRVPRQAVSLCWSSDDLIAFAAPLSIENGRVFVVDADGRSVTQVTKAPDTNDRNVTCTR